MDTRSNITTSELDSPYAWARLAAAVALGTVGGVGMWSMPVVLPAVQAEFAIARGDASLPFTLSMFGFALGGVMMGRLQDRRGHWLRRSRNGLPSLSRQGHLALEKSR